MSDNQTPPFPVADLELLPLEVLKTPLAEVRQYFQSQLDETTSVTSKTIQFGLGFLSFLFGVSMLILLSIRLPVSSLCYMLVRLLILESPLIYFWEERATSWPCEAKIF